MVLVRDVCSSCSPGAAAGGHEDLPCPVEKSVIHDVFGDVGKIIGKS